MEQCRLERDQSGDEEKRRGLSQKSRKEMSQGRIWGEKLGDLRELGRLNEGVGSWMGCGGQGKRGG